MTFEEAKELFSKAKNKNAGKPLELNTRLIQLSDDCYGILLHNTVVVEIWEDGQYKLNTGGWYTRTTKKRINRYSPVKIYSKANQWFVNNNEGIIYPFENGMSVYE